METKGESEREIKRRQKGEKRERQGLAPPHHNEVTHRNNIFFLPYIKTIFSASAHPFS